jgi:hypothetical protein
MVKRVREILAEIEAAHPEYFADKPVTQPSTNGQPVPSGLISDGTGPTTPWGRKALDGELAHLDAVAGPHSHRRNIQLNTSAWE